MEKTTQSRAKVIVITQSAFWQDGNGLASRTRELVKFLARETDLSLVYLKPLQQSDVDQIRKLGISFELHPIGNERPITMHSLLTRFRQLFNEHSAPATYLVVQTEIAFFAEAIPANGQKLLDINDLVSDRSTSFARHGAQDHFPLTQEQEVAIFHRFDGVICIQQDEYEKVRHWIGANKTILASHPVRINQVTLRASASRIGFAASTWHPNVGGLKWFVEQVWPKLLDRELSLNVYGPICGEISQWKVPQMRLHGIVQEMSECHAALDVFINPILYGAGLKIKTVEAMAAGLPIVTTPHGANGLHSLNGAGFLVAQDESEFAEHVCTLVDSFDERVRLAECAAAYVGSNFSETCCFSGILQRITGFSVSR